VKESLSIQIPGKPLSGNSGATLVEFAIVVPLLLLILFGIITIAVVYQAKSALEKGAEQGLAVATVIADLENRADIDQFNGLQEEIRRQAVEHPLSVFFENGVNELGGVAPYGSSRITEVNLDILPQPQPDSGSLPDDLSEYFSDNPIAVELVAEVNTLFWFLPPITLRAEAIGYREPRFVSTLPRPFVCDEDEPGGFKEINFRFEIPEECPCPGDAIDDPRVVFNVDSGTCLCAAPFTQAGPDPGNHPEVCVCADPLQKYNDPDYPTGCICRDCEEQGWPDGILGPGCVCECGTNFQGQYDDVSGITSCICPTEPRIQCGGPGAPMESKYILSGTACVCNASCVAASCEAMSPPRVFNNSTCGCSTCSNTMQCGEEHPPIDRCQIVSDPEGPAACKCDSSAVRSCCHAKNSPYKGALDSHGCNHGNCNCSAPCPGDQIVNPDNNQCECPPGSPTPESCAQQGRPYNAEHCDCGPPCAISNQELINGICQCPPCGPGETSGPGCSCDPCPAELHPDPSGTECVCWASLNELQSNITSCNASNGEYDVEECQCIPCPEGKIFSPEAGRCVCDPSICGAYLDPVGEDCACGCPDGYVYLENACGGSPCCQPPNCPDCYYDGGWKTSE